MPKYTDFKYLYPPRPKNAIDPSELNDWDSGTLIGQPKMNGSNSLIFTNGVNHNVMNRHNQRLTNFRIIEKELKEIYRGNDWMVINGEYMNKSKSDENGTVFNHKLIIFDILVYNGEYLIGSTFEERSSLLDSIYGKVSSEKDYLYRISDNVYRVKSYESGFKDLYDNISKIDMVEGLVLKRKNSRLEIGNTENNNVRGQIKSRKPTKNYKY